MEILFALFNRGLERRIVSLSAHSTLNFICAIAGAVEYAAKQIARGTQYTAGRAGY